jgi:hypothetical protein
VVLEPEDKKAFAKLIELQLRGYVSAPQGSVSVPQSALSSISPDGSFRLGGLSPGQLNIWLAAQMGLGQPKGFNILRVEHNGTVMPNGFEIKEGDQLTGVRLIVTYGTASVHGVVKIENGPLPEGARLFARLFRSGTPPTVVGSVPVDARGQFLFEGIPAGVFEVSTMVYLPGAKSPPTVKREVNVQDGVVNEVALTLDLTATPPPKP